MEIIAAIIIGVVLLVVFLVLARLAFRLPLWIFTSLSGWGNLSSRFPASVSDPEATTYRFCSVRLGVVDYGACVNVLLSQDHVLLRIGFPFRDFHPNICIPRSLLKRGLRTTFWLTEFTIVGEDISIWFGRRISRELIDKQPCVGKLA